MPDDKKPRTEGDRRADIETLIKHGHMSAEEAKRIVDQVPTRVRAPNLDDLKGMFG